MSPMFSVTEAAVSDAVGGTDRLSWWIKLLGLLVAVFVAMG